MATGLTDLVFNSSNILDQFFIGARNILWGAEIFFINAYVVIIITLFFVLVLAMFYLPIKFYPYYVENKKMFDKIIRINKKIK